jgi:hypothetical protein
MLIDHNIFKLGRSSLIQLLGWPTWNNKGDNQMLDKEGNIWIRIKYLHLAKNSLTLWRTNNRTLIDLYPHIVSCQSKTCKTTNYCWIMKWTGQMRNLKETIQNNISHLGNFQDKTMVRTMRKKKILKCKI